MRSASEANTSERRNVGPDLMGILNMQLTAGRVGAVGSVNSTIAHVRSSSGTAPEHCTGFLYLSRVCKCSSPVRLCDKSMCDEHIYFMMSPRRVSVGSAVGPDWVATITNLAAANGGFLVAQDVAAAGIDQAWLSRLAARGRIERRAQGLYRMAGWPVSRLDEFRQATLWARRRGVIAGESALDLWDLSHVVPRVIDLIVEPGYRPRKAGGETYRIRRRTLTLEAVDQVDGIGVLSPFATIQDCIHAGTSSREITTAIDTAQARELINRREAARLLVQLDAREER